MFGLSFWRHPFTAEDPFVNYSFNISVNYFSSLSLHQVFNALIKDKEMEKGSSPTVKNSWTLTICIFPVDFNSRLEERIV